LFLLAALPFVASPVFAADVYPAEEWGEVPPAESGLSESHLDALAALVGGAGVVIHRGYLVYSWGDVARPLDWASASKPVMGNLLWMAVEEGRCTFESTTGDFLDGGSSKDRAITLSDLSNMVSGYSRAEGSGDAWAYNDHGVNLFGHLLYNEIFEASTPTALFLERFPLGFEDTVYLSPSKIGRITDMSVRDFARVGLLWLRRGEWQGTQLIPEAYFDLLENQVPDALPVTSSDGAESWDFGTFGGTDDQLPWGPGHYAFGFWVNSNGLWSELDSDTFQANGHWGREVCTVIPEHDLVVASGFGDWSHPSTAALELIIEVIEQDGSQTPTADTSWSELKSRYYPTP
jgi:CubicO group peptidase (beta-lactamase class C family)